MGKVYWCNNCQKIKRKKKCECGTSCIEVEEWKLD